MKRSGLKTVIALLILQVAFFLPASADGVEVNKKFNKEFSSQGKDLLSVDNRYGDVKVESWNENRVVIDVLVTIEHPDRDKAEKLLSMIEVEFTENDNTIGAKTVIDSKFSFKGWGDNYKFSIDYVVKMPVKLNFNVVNRYGSVDIDELSGHADISVKYGSLFVGKLTRENEKPLNKISLGYSKAEIIEMGWTELYLRYCGRTNIGTAQAVMIDSRYSKLEIENVGSVVLDSKYDNINITSLKNLVSESGYTSYNLGTVSGKLDIETGYGSVEVDKLVNGFESVDITSKYCSVKIDVDENASYQFNAGVQYGGLSFNEDNAEIMSRIYENNSKNVKAIIGGKNASSVMNIQTSYGSVKIY